MRQGVATKERAKDDDANETPDGVGEVVGDRKGVELKGDVGLKVRGPHQGTCDWQSKVSRRRVRRRVARLAIVVLVSSNTLGDVELFW